MDAAIVADAATAVVATVVESCVGDALEVWLTTTVGHNFGTRCALFTDFIAIEEIGANFNSFVCC